jgi:hypothetical protein
MYDDEPLIPLGELDEFLADHPHVSVELVADVNHFTLIIGSGHGPRRVAATLAALAQRWSAASGGRLRGFPEKKVTR